jgi:hypothetical protein
MPLFRPLPPDTDKETRAQDAASISTQAQHLLLESAPWEDTARREMLAFDNGLHDDIVDTISYGAIEFTKGRLVATPEPKPKPELTIVEKIEAQIRRRQKKPPKSSKTLMNT